jgi:gluconolactonase
MHKKLSLHVISLLMASTLAVAATSGGDNDGSPATGAIERLDPRFDEIVPHDAVLEKLATGFLWAEGPVWIKPSSEAGHLLFSDIPNNSVLKWKEGEGIQLFLKPSGYTGKRSHGGLMGSNGLTVDAAGRLVLCQHGDRRIVRQEPDGRWTTLADRYEGKRFNSPNDLVFKSNGDLYFTDPIYGLPKGLGDPAREMDACGVYRLSASDGKLMLLTKALTLPNGLAFSPDEKTLYVAQSDPKKAVWFAFPVKSDGTLGDAHVLADATHWTAKPQGMPDGLKIDRYGNLFATGPGGVNVISPEGVLLGRIHTERTAANCTFDGEGSTLYITATDCLYRIRTKTQAGRLHGEQQMAGCAPK